MYIHKSLKLANLALLFVALTIFSGCAGTAPPINHAPTIVSLTANPQSPIEVNQSTVITCLATDQDGDHLYYSWTGTGGTITGSGSTITWTAPAIAGTYTITCTVSDGNGGQDSESVNIEVFELDDETKITNTIYGLFQAFNDEDWNTAKSYCVYGSEVYQEIVYAEQCYNLYGAYECDIPDEFIVNNINPIIINGNYAETYVYLTTIWGSIEDSGENWLYLQKINNDWRLYGAGGVTPENQAPVITSTPVTSATKDEPYSYDVNATDSDGDTLIYSLTTKPIGMSINSSTGLIAWTPTAIGDFNVTVKVSDGELSNTQSYTIRVVDDNHAPVISNIYAPSSVETDQTTTITCIASDPDGDPLTYYWTKTGGIITGSGSTITWRAPSTEGNYTVSCTVSDGKEGEDSESVNIIVGGNHPPIITSTPVTSVTLPDTYTYTVVATDEDGDDLTYSLPASLPFGMTISATGVITWTPSAAGSYYITVEVSDGELSDVQSFTITVIAFEVNLFIGEWTAISPTRISKVKIHSSGNKIIIHEWRRGSEEHPEDYDWGEQIVEISDFSDGTLELNWTIYSEWSCNQKIKLLANGALKIFSTENNYAGDYSLTYTDYFYNPEAINSYIPSLPGVGLYQDDPEFINLVNTLNNPKKIGQYMENNISYKALSGPHSPYQTYLSKEGDCGDYAVFASGIANFHSYECYYIIMNWTCGACHAITVYNMGGYYTYSSDYLYFDQRFDSIEECVNHCASTYIGYIEGNLSSYETYSWDYYNYRTSHLF